MTISSLQDLNTYAQTPITYDDVRTAQVLFDRGATVDQTLVTPENSQFISPWGINIETITQPDVAEVEYHLDYSAFADPISITWPFLPAHMSVTRTNNTWIVSGITNSDDWLYARNAQVLPPFGFSGFVAHSAAIHYYSDTQDSTKNIASWDINLTVTQVEYFSGVADQLYVSNTLYSNISTTSILTDPEDFDPVWDLRIYSADENLNAVDALEEVFSDGSAAEATWNSSLKQYIVTGDTESINDVLSTLDIETKKYSTDFFLTFRLANNFTSDLEYQVQRFNSRDFISDPAVIATQTTTAKRFLGFVADPFPVFAAFDFGADTPMIRDPNPTTISSAFAQTSTGLKVPGDHMSNAGASTIRTGETQTILNTPTLQNTYPAGIAPTFTVVITTSSGTQPEEITTAGSGGTVTWDDTNPNAKSLTIVGTQTQVNSHLASLSIEYGVDLAANTTLRYQTAWDFVNPVVDNVYQTLTYAPDILNINDERDYFAGKLNSIFDSTTPLPDNPGYTTFALTLSVVNGDFEYGETFSNSITVTGTVSTLGDLLQTVDYYPDYGQTADETVTYSITKDGVAGQNGTFNLDYSGAGVFTSGSYQFATSGSYTWTPTREERLYGEMDYAVVGGGGGGSYPGQMLAYNASPPNPGYTDSSNGSQGGGGGAVASQTDVAISSDSYSVTVGAGGAGGDGSYDSGEDTYILHGDGGELSLFNSTTALGGGGASAYFDYANDPYYGGSSVYPELVTGLGGGVAGDSGNGNAGRDVTNVSGMTVNEVVGGDGVISTGGAGSGGSGSSNVIQVSDIIAVPSNWSAANSSPGAGTTVTLNGVAHTNLGAGGWGATGAASKVLLDNASVSPPTLFFATRTAGSGGYGYNGWLTSSHNGKDGAVIIKTRNK